MENKGCVYPAVQAKAIVWLLVSTQLSQIPNKNLGTTAWSFAFLDVSENIVYHTLNRLRCRGIEMARAVRAHCIPFNDSRRLVDCGCSLHQPLQISSTTCKGFVRDGKRGAIVSYYLLEYVIASLWNILELVKPSGRPAKSAIPGSYNGERSVFLVEDFYGLWRSAIWASSLLLPQ